MCKLSQRLTNANAASVSQNNRELKQVRTTTTTLKKQSKFLYLKETTDYWLRVAYSLNILWHLKRFKVSKRIVLAILKLILSNSFHLYVSWRRLEDVKIHWVALYTERGRHGITLGTENYSFSLFCMNDCIVYETSSSRLTSCLLKLPITSVTTSSQVYFSIQCQPRLGVIVPRTNSRIAIL